MRCAPRSSTTGGAFWGPVVACTAASAGIFTGFALLDAQQQREAASAAKRWARKKITTPEWLPESLQPAYLQVISRWKQLPETERMVYSIIAANAGVALLWRVRPLQVHKTAGMYPISVWTSLHFNILVARDIAYELTYMQGFMLRYFALHLPPVRPNYVTFFTANFSHAGLLHFGINMVALSSFGSVVARVSPANALAISCSDDCHHMQEDACLMCRILAPISLAHSS